MKKQIRYLILIVPVIVLLFILFLVLNDKTPDIKEFTTIERLPKIYPDYSAIVIPPNIAPLNFIIKEIGDDFLAEIKSSNKIIRISSSDGKIIIPFDDWKELLSENRGKKILFDIFTKNNNNKWLRFKSIENKIANENIDPYLAYRLIHPGHQFWAKMGIYQRNLENFDEEPILVNRATDWSCMNCHNFCNNDPDKMMIHLRMSPGAGTIINSNGKLIKINTATAFSKAGSYPSWHPSGKLIAFSVNKLTMFFHAIGESRDVLDHASDIIIYDIDKNMITSSPDISSADRMETFPAWSPDGKYLYFCSSKNLESYIIKKDESEELPYNEIKYDLMRIRYYQENGGWGKPEIVLSSAETGQTILEPRVSPDGNFILFTMSKYGNFPIYRENSDVYILDLKTMKYYQPDVNSNKAETFHSWSSNSRWFVFASKRDDGFCARPYFSYFDNNGKSYKPFILPQKDPEFYDGYLITYNVPELIKGKVKISPQELTEFANDSLITMKAKLDPNLKPREKVKLKVDKQYAPG
jgi:hypothetical protein